MSAECELETVHSELHILGVHCGGCTRTIESRVGALPGVTSICVDANSGHASLAWEPEHIALRDVMREIERLGFRPQPLEQAAAEHAHKQERDDLLRRLVVGGIGMMQVTMFAVGGWFGAGGDMDPAIARLLQFVSMVVATPVVFFAGAPFLHGAWSSLRARAPSMDVPVALALLLAWGASCFNYFRGTGQTYFESATMFVFLMLCSRFVALLVRHRALDANLALLPLLPDTVVRLDGHRETRIARAALRPGDRIRLRPGDAVPADGRVAAGRTTVDEALLTGESTPCPRSAGERLLAGSVNLDGSIEMTVEAVAKDTRIASMAALLLRAQRARPRRMLLADRVASWFVGVILVLAIGVFAAWSQVDPERAFAATLAVLVVTCPCALALAIPTVLSAAAARLARSGLLLTRLDALETLARVNVALFDKTGTLSRGRPQLSRLEPNPTHARAVDATRLRELVAVLERQTNHPLAAAFADVRTDASLRATQVETIPGQGVRGRIDGRELRVGNAAFTGLADGRAATVNVVDQDGLLGRIEIEDAWRADAAGAIGALRERGVVCRILSGDRPDRVDVAVRALGLDGGAGALTPEAKLARLRDTQADGATVLAVGDGVNDGALLAGADVSVAMAGGADLAKAGADVVLTGDGLAPLQELLAVAVDVRRIVRQNLAWAIGYNLLAVPLAALGYIGPGLAALGMSASSLVVILNAARVARARARRATGHPSGALPLPEPGA